MVQKQCTIQRKEPSLPNMILFLLWSGEIFLPIQLDATKTKLFLYIFKQESTPEWGLKDILQNIPWVVSECLLGVVLRGDCPPSCFLRHQSRPGLQVELSVPTINFRSACNIPRAFILDWQWH